MSTQQQLLPTLNMDFQALSHLRAQLTDSGYVEYLYYKFFNGLNITFTGLEQHTTWQYPECWLARYWLNYVVHGHLLKDASILELGSNFCFYSVWAILHGAKSVTGIEPDSNRQLLSKEYVHIRGLSDKISTRCMSINQFMHNYQSQQYDVVLFQDVLSHLDNGIEVLNFIKKQVRPKYLFLESSVVNDVMSNGHFEIWYPSTQSKDFESYEHPEKFTPVGLTPSRHALRNVINYHGWEILCYYNYQDFIGHGESIPRRNGCKDFYILYNLDN